MVAALNHTWLNGTGGDTWTTSEDQDPPEPPDVGVVEAAVAAALDPENIRDIDQVLGEGDPFRQGLFWWRMLIVTLCVLLKPIFQKKNLIFIFNK